MQDLFTRRGSSTTQVRLEQGTSHTSNTVWQGWKTIASEAVQGLSSNYRYDKH